MSWVSKTTEYDLKQIFANFCPVAVIEPAPFESSQAFAHRTLSSSIFDFLKHFLHQSFLVGERKCIPIEIMGKLLNEMSLE